MSYQCTFICSPELDSTKVEEIVSKVSNLIETAGGTIKNLQQLGKKKLAYNINKFREGIYVYVDFVLVYVLWSNAWSKVSLPVMWLGLTFVLSEKVGMCACINHDKNKLLVVLLPDKQPIRLNVTLPLVFAVTL